MPDGYVCYSPPPHAPDVIEAPALKNGFVTFGCFNNLAKITPLVTGNLGEYFMSCPDGSRTDFHKTHQLSHPPTADGVRANFAALGVEVDRIELRGSSGHRAFHGRIW